MGWTEWAEEHEALRDAVVETAMAIKNTASPEQYKHASAILHKAIDTLTKFEAEYDEPRNKCEPDTVSHPGETLAEVIRERDLYPGVLAARMMGAFSCCHICSLLAGKANITSALAQALEKELDIPADFWLERQRLYDKGRAKQEAEHA